MDKTQELQNQIEELRQQINNLYNKRDSLSSPQLDPQTFDVLYQNFGIRYTETEPTHKPNKQTEAWIYYDNTNYYLYIYANGDWRKVTLS